MTQHKGPAHASPPDAAAISAATNAARLHFRAVAQAAAAQAGVGPRVRAARDAAGMSLRGLAKAAGVGVSTVATIEADQKSPRVSTLQRVASALGVEAHELLGSGGGASLDAVQAREDAAAEGKIAEWLAGMLAAHTGIDKGTWLQLAILKTMKGEPDGD